MAKKRSDRINLMNFKVIKKNQPMRAELARAVKKLQFVKLYNIPGEFVEF